MNARIKQLRDLVVALDRADRHLESLDPDAYRAAAQKALMLTRQEMGLLPMSDFAGPANALQNMAENIFFGNNGCFADLDGSGRAPVAMTAGKALIGRIRATSTTAVDEIAESLFARLGASSAPAGPRRRRRIVGTRA